MGKTLENGLVAFVVVYTLIIIGIFIATSPAPVQAQFAASTGFNYTAITASGAQQIKPVSGGMIHNLMINGGTLSGTITIVDTSAANCTGGTTVAVIAASQTAGQNYVYDAQFANGICINPSANVNATLTWR